MAFEWIDKLLNGKVEKEANLISQGENAADHFERKVQAHDWIKGVSELDEKQVEAEYLAAQAAEARTLGKTAAHEFKSDEEVIKGDYERDAKALSDYALAEMLAELRCSKAQNTQEMFHEAKEKAKKEVASSREKAEKALLDLIPDHTQLDWKKSFERFSKEAKPEEPKEKELFEPKAPEAAHDFDKPTEEKFKLPKDQDKAIPGNGREADERKDVTAEAGVLQESLTEGLGKVAHCGTCPSDKQASPEELDKEAASNGAVIQSFVGGQGGASSTNLHIVKGTKGMVLVNYETPIAYRSAEGELFLNIDKYSPTTSKIQSAIKAAAGGQVKEVSAAELESAMEGKPGIVPNAPAAVAPIAEKTAEPVSPLKREELPVQKEGCPVCGSIGKDLGNGQKDNMSCEACGVTYACASLDAKAGAHEGWDVFLNGKWIDTVFASGYDADEMKRSLINHDGYDPNIEVRKEHRKKASEEIKSQASKEEVLKIMKTAEVNSPWAVIKDENGNEVIARVDHPTNKKESEEDTTEDLQK